MSASVSTVADGHKTKIPAKMEEPLTKLLKKKRKDVQWWSDYRQTI